VNNSVKSQLLIAGLLGIAIGILPITSAADAVQPLRGDASIPSTTSPPQLPRQKIQEGSFSRAWEEQPPLIPHRMEKYQIDVKVNQCLSCHDRTKHEQSGATEISDAHYRNRDGKELEQIARGRWFCNQCHIPQSDISPTVENTFRGAAQ